MSMFYTFVQGRWARTMHSRLKKRGSRKFPDTLEQPKIVTWSLAYLKLVAFASPEALNEQEGVIRHHKPVSSALNI